MKIDCSFADDIEAGSHYATHLETIISLAHKLDLKVVAEGIETEKQLEFLRLCHCDMGQGKYLSEPLTVERFQRFVEA